jgi:hypothetical protein
MIIDVRLINPEQLEYSADWSVRLVYNDAWQTLRINVSNKKALH